MSRNSRSQRLHSNAVKQNFGITAVISLSTLASCADSDAAGNGSVGALPVLPAADSANPSATNTDANEPGSDSASSNSAGSNSAGSSPASSNGETASGEAPGDNIALATDTDPQAGASGEAGESATGSDNENVGDTAGKEPPVTTGLSPVENSPVENSGADCPVANLPGFNQLQAIDALPDPFLSMDGTRITTKEQWTCRRAEISAQVQQYELGPKPVKPSIVTGDFANGQLTITAGEPGGTVNFSVGVNRPNGANGSVPAVIEIGGSSLDNSVFSERGIARINFNNGAMGAQNGGNSRGGGTFYDLYGQNHGAGSMMAWAWGVSRIIDALEQTPEAGIDVTRLAVTGCSRNGKGALVAGAFDERIVLTIPQESGAGGSASWRISQVMEDAALAADPNAGFDTRVQTISSAQGEQPWFRASFGQFGNAVTRLPFDHHMLMGMVAPRSLFVIDNTTQSWLGNESSFTDSVAAAEIWVGLDLAGTMGASQVGDHNHCAFPANQRAELVAFVEKYLVGDQSANTDILRSDGITPDRARWMPWSTPDLQ